MQDDDQVFGAKIRLKDIPSNPGTRGKVRMVLVAFIGCICRAFFRVVQ